MAFCGCSSLTDITIPDGVTSIVYRAFFDCSSLTDITIPDSVTSIGDDAFSGCSGLTDITIPDSVTFIGSSAFWGCSSLTDITIPDGVTSIGYRAFCGCNNLITAYIPKSVTEIGSEPFLYCGDLKDIYFGGTEEEWNAFDVTLSDNGDGYPIVHFGAIVTYNANGGTGTMEDALVYTSEVYTLPDCGFTAPSGKEFKAWQINGEEYTPESSYTITSNTTVTALWQDATTTPTQPVNPSEPVTEYTLTGTITGHKGVTYTSVTAQLVGSDGSAYSAEVGAGVVDNTGKTVYAYTVSAPAGQYNLNVTATTAAGIVVNRTAVINLTGNGQTQNINLPNGQASSSGSSSGNSSNSNYKVSIPTNINGGTVTVSPTNAKTGATVTITASPNKGYELESIGVKDSKGNSIAVTEVGNGKYTFTMPSSSVSVSAAFVIAAPAPVTTFIDVEPGAYYADAVAWAVENGITSGTGDGKFSPNEPCTRSQMVTFLWRAAGCPEVDITTAFADVAPGSYYEMAVAWAVANGITNGAGDGRFSPNEPCTRAQAVTFLYRAKGSPSADEGSFNDVGSGLWYTDAVAWAVANGITNGTGNGLFSPDDICTRGQIVTFLYRDMA